MEPLPVDIVQLQRRDPLAWSTLLARYPETSDAVVTAVTSEPLYDPSLAVPSHLISDCSHHIRRYILTLAGTSDPITFIAKRTNAAEARFYSLYGDPPGTAIPRCHYVYLDGEESWVVLDDIPAHYPSVDWMPDQIDDVAETLARVHAARWNYNLETDDDLGHSEPLIPHFLRRRGGPYRWAELREMETALFDEGPGVALSRHAIHSAGRLAPLFLRAANGLIVMRALNGWPGVMGESHLSAVADLLDDPVPMLAPLLDLPLTLLHGAPHPGHWRLTLFGDAYLVDWSETQIGPGVLDLMAFMEGYPLLQFSPRERGSQVLHHAAPGALSPLTEETIVDTYLLTLSAELGSRSAARAYRAALPAARCLHVLLTWFPYFATWADNMPDRYMWQRVNRRAETEPGRYHDAPDAGLRQYLAGVFDRFLQACRSL